MLTSTRQESSLFCCIVTLSIFYQSSDYNVIDIQQAVGAVFSNPIVFTSNHSLQ